MLYLLVSYCTIQSILILFFFFFNDTATTEIYTLSLHDALPIYVGRDRSQGERASRHEGPRGRGRRGGPTPRGVGADPHRTRPRSAPAGLPAGGAGSGAVCFTPRRGARRPAAARRRCAVGRAAPATPGARRPRGGVPRRSAPARHPFPLARRPAAPSRPEAASPRRRRRRAGATRSPRPARGRALRPRVRREPRPPRPGAGAPAAGSARAGG